MMSTKAVNKFNCVGRIRQLMPAEAFCTDKTIDMSILRSLSVLLHYTLSKTAGSEASSISLKVNIGFSENLDKAFQTLRLTDKQIIIGFHFNWYNAYPQNLRKENEYKFKSPDNRLLYSLPGDHTVNLQIL